MRSNWTFYTAPVTYAVSLERAGASPPEGYQRALYVPFRSWARDAFQRAQLFELYEALFRTSVPRPPSDEDVRLVCERLEGAFRSGGLVVYRALPSPTTILASQTAPAPVPKPPPPPVPTSEERTWFQISFVDEIGQGIGGQDVAFSCSGTQQKKPTDGNGMARLDDVEAASSFGNASIEIDPVRDELKPRWDQIRQGKILTEEDDVKVFFLRGDHIDPIAIEAETPLTVSIQPYVELARLIGMFFDTNKNFLLPKAIPSIRRVKWLYDENPKSTLLVVGHTDTTGEPSYNDPLSLERAQSVAEYLTDDVDAWLKRYDHSVYYKKRWGSDEDRLMVHALEQYGPKTPDQPPLAGEPAISWYQKWHNRLPAAKRADNWAELDEDGHAGTNTRTQLIGDYMNLDDTSLPTGTNLVCHGCGENFPLDKSGDEVDPDAPQGEHDQQDRRVELFFFDGKLGVQPPPPGQNSKPGSQQYPEWRRRSRRMIDMVLQPGASTAMRVPTRFSLQRTFPKPSLVAAAREIAQHMASEPFSKLVIVGHADPPGSDSVNQELSLSRAKACRALLTGDSEYFLDRFKTKDPLTVWDWEEVQWMLHGVTVPETDEPLYIGAADAAPGRATELALAAFQLCHPDLAVNYACDQPTLELLVGEYLALLDDVPRPAADRIDVVGGGSWTLPRPFGKPSPAPTQDDHDNFPEPDRRCVDFFLFDLSPVPPVEAFPTSRDDTGKVYGKWCAKVHDELIAPEWPLWLRVADTGHVVQAGVSAAISPVDGEGGGSVATSRLGGGSVALPHGFYVAELTVHQAQQVGLLHEPDESCGHLALVATTPLAGP